MLGKAGQTAVIAVAAVTAFLGVERLTNVPSKDALSFPADLVVPTKLTERPAVTPAALPVETTASRCAAQTGPAGVMVGDRIELRVFEALSDQRPEAGASRFERRDIGGTYDIGADGTLSIPGLDRIALDRKTLACAEALVEAELAEALGVEAQASARFASRMPVLVQGVVGAPGSYDYTPGLTVRRLLARAGNGDNGPADQQRRSILTSQRAELEVRNAALDLTLARLAALRDGRDTLDLSQDQRDGMERILGPAQVDSEVLALTSEIQTRRLEDQRIDTRRQDLTRARDRAMQQLATIQQSLADMSLRRDALADELSIECRGRCANDRITKEIRLDSLEGRVSDFNIQLQDRQMAVDASDAALRLLDGEQALMDANRRESLTARLLQTNEAKLGVRTQMSEIDRQLAEIGGPADDLQVVIEGLLAGRQGMFLANPDTVLLPGDLVTISLPDHGTAAALKDKASRPTDRTDLQ